MKRTSASNAGRALLAGIVAATLLAACAPERVVVRETVVEKPVVRTMPAPIREDRGQQPGPDWNWVPGHWKWEGNNWAWIHGRWVQTAVPPMPPVIVEQITVAPSQHHYWVPGHWVWNFTAGAWAWVHGNWHG